MILVECYKTVDGQLFEDERKAIDHTNDLIGQEIDGLLRLVGGIETRHREVFNGMLNMLKIENRKELKKSIDNLYHILNFEYND